MDPTIKRSRIIVIIFLNSIVNGIATINDDRPYRNLYGRDDFNRTTYENFVNIANGSRDFVANGARYMSEEPPDTSPPKFEGANYDFIVVGAGTAGATIASRLSEISNVTVLLIEAGRSENLVMDIPLAVNLFQFNRQINWMYKTEPSNGYCLGMRNRQCAWPRGKVMGGSSVLNYMIATRGNKLDYERWAQLGNNGWSWNDVLPYFKKLETMGIPELRNDTVHHNFGGPVYTDHVPFRTPLASAFVEAGREMGYDNVDYNGARHTGFSYLQTTIKHGTRMSSNRAYLHRARKRTNLFVTKMSLATRIIINDEKRAIGVEFVKSNDKYRVYATKEVIVCAGAIGSAQLLMLSGIGPAKHLKDVGIKSLVDLPVGENLMDHIAYGGLIFVVDQPVGVSMRDMIDPRLPYLGDFLNNREGPLTIPGGTEALGFINVDDDDDDSKDYPNVELLFVCTSIGTVPIIRDNLNLREDFWRESYGKVGSSYSWTIFPMLLRPKSRGRILLRDADVNSKPRLIPNYMSHPDDVRILVKAIRAALAVSRTKAMSKFGSKLHRQKVAGCEAFDNDSDDYWECAVRSFTMNIYHYSGTCKMGKETDETAVVNPKLQVIGVRGLRVADASIMPEIITGHPNIPIFMIAEKLSDMVKQDWGYPTDPLP